MSKKKIKFGLSVREVERAIKEIEKYKQDIIRNTKLLAYRLSQEGVYIARVKIAEYDAIYTGELLASINNEHGAVIENGDTWIIYTGCEWAPFVEFGTGVKGEKSPHPATSIIGWKYDINEHGESGWSYFKDGAWHWTKGMISRPFMFETGIDLRKLIVKTAKEVFK